MKIKTYISNAIAIFTLIMLVGGFQFNNVNTEVNTTDKLLGVEEAYAGPCGSAGCVGKTGYCGKEVTVVKILDWELDKECYGEDRSDGTEPVE